MTEVFTIGSGRNGTKSMAVILGTVFKRSYHEFSQTTAERRKTFLHMSYYGPKLKAKIKKYQRMGEFHDSDNCNTVFIHHLCKAFPQARILLPIGSPRSFIRAHRAWGIMGIGDRHTNTRMFPPNNKWDAWPVVVKLAWLWGKRNLEAIRRADRNRLMIFRTKDIANKLGEIFNFIEKPINKTAIRLSKTKHNKLQWSYDKTMAVENEIDNNIVRIEEVISSFKRTMEKYYPSVFK